MCRLRDADVDVDAGLPFDCLTFGAVDGVVVVVLAVNSTGCSCDEHIFCSRLLTVFLDALGCETGAAFWTVAVG